VNPSNQARSANWLVFGAMIALTANIAPAIFHTFGLFIKPVSEELGFSRSALSAALLIITAVTVVVSPYVGRLIDRHGVTKITMPCIIIFAVAVAALAGTHSLAYFLAAFFVMGLVGIAHSPLSYSREISRRFDRHRGKALGIASAGIGIGGAIIPLIAQRSIEAYGWRSAYLILGAIIISVGLIGFYFFQRGIDNRLMNRGGQAAGGPGGDAEKRFKKSTIFWSLLVGFLIMGIGINGSMSHLGAILSDRGGSLSFAGSAQVAVGISMIVGRVLCGFLLDRFAPYNIATLFVLIPMAGIATLATSTDPTVIVLGCVLLGLGLGGEADLLTFLTARYFNLASYAEISGYFFSAFTLGVGVGSFALARSFDMMGSYQTGMFLSVALLLVLCVVFQSLRFMAPAVAPRLDDAVVPAP